jgi:hypothetical protein
MGSKLFKLKAWLTLPEAAKHLSGVFEEEVTVADILLLALDKHLTLSVNFVNHAKARQRKIIHFDEKELKNLIERGEYPSEFKFAKMLFSDQKLMLASRIDEGKFMTEAAKTVTIDGIWDLPMIGGEVISIEKKYQELTGGPLINLINMDGCFVARNTDIVFMLQDTSDDYNYNDYRSKWQCEITKLRRLQSFKTSNPRKEKILLLRKEKVQEHYDALNEWNKEGRYFSACEMPEDIVLVVRTDALREFEKLIADNSNQKSKSTKIHGNTVRYSQNREQVLGAASSVISQWPDQCQSSSGKFVAAKIAALIDEKALLFWPLTGNPPLGREKIERNISEWLKKTDR